MTTPNVKPSGAMLTLGTITLIISAYGLYGLLHDYAGAPALIAALGIAGLDLTALAAGRHAIDLARDGDSPAAWNLVVIMVALVSAGAQYAHQTLTGAPWIVGVVFACFPLATVLLYEGTLRRAARLAGRESGRVAPPRATFELLQWLVYRRATWRAFQLSVADRSLGADGAFKIGLLATAPQPEKPADRRRGVTINYAQALGLGELLAITDGQADTSKDTSDDLAGRPPAIAQLVRDAVSAGHTSDPDVLAHVRETRPDVDPATVRRTLARQLSA